MVKITTTMEFKDFINYHKQCPICAGDFKILGDMYLTSKGTIDEEGVTLREKRSSGSQVEPAIIKLMFDNTVIANKQYKLNTFAAMIRRTFLSKSLNEWDPCQIQLSCAKCNKFKYWSKIFRIQNLKIPDIIFEGESIKYNSGFEIQVRPVKKELIVLNNHSTYARVSFEGRLNDLPIHDEKATKDVIDKFLILS